MSVFTSFLKKFGLDAEKVAKTLLGGPTIIVQEAEKIPVVVNDLKASIDLVKETELLFANSKLPGQLGSAKLAACQPQILAILKDVEIIGGTKMGSKIIDEVAFNEGAADFTNALVKMLNACGE